MYPDSGSPWNHTKSSLDRHCRADNGDGTIKKRQIVQYNPREGPSQEEVTNIFKGDLFWTAVTNLGVDYNITMVAGQRLQVKGGDN